MTPPGHTGGSRVLGALSCLHGPFPAWAGAVWAPAVPMATADHASGTAGARAVALTCGCRLGGPSGLRSKPGRWWKLSLGAVGKGEAYARWQRLTHQAPRQCSGVAVQPNWSGPLQGAPLPPPPIRRTWAGLAHHPARRMTLEGKLPALWPEVQLQPKRRRGEMGRLPRRHRRVSRSRLRGAPGVTAESPGPGLRSAAPSPQPPTCDHSPPRPGRRARLPAPSQPPLRPPGSVRQVHARFRVPRPRRRGSPPVRTCAARLPAVPAGEAPPPGPRPWRREGENRLPRACPGGRGRRWVPHLRPAPPRPAPPQRRQPGAAPVGQPPEPRGADEVRRRKYGKPGNPEDFRTT